MNTSITGNAIGSDTYAAQQAAAIVWASTYGATFVSLSKADQTALIDALALQMAQIAGNAVITHAPGWDSVSYAPNTGLGLDRPIPALAQQVTGGGSFVALWLKTGTATTAWTSFGGGGGSPLELGTAMATQDGGPGAVGVSLKASHEDHAHAAAPVVPPAVVSSYFFPAEMPDTKLRAPCKYVLYVPDLQLHASCVGLLPHGEGVGFGGTWTASGTTWVFTSAGPLVPSDGTLQAQDGDLIFAWSSVPYGSYEPMAYGVYRVVDCGLHIIGGIPTSSQPVITRDSSANTPAGLCHGMTVQIVGRDAVEHNGDYFTLTTADPIVVDTTALTFTYAGSYTSPTTAQRAVGGAIFSQWTQIAGASTWQSNFVGAVVGYRTGGPPNAPLSIGDRVFVPCDGGTASPYTASPRLGIYEIVNPGSSSTQAIIRRVADANTPAGLCNGMTVEISGDSAALDFGEFFTLLTVDPIVVDTSVLSFSEAGSYSPSTTWALLTDPQLIAEGADTTDTFTIAATGTGTVGLAPPTFPSLPGTPGVSSFPAALYGFQVANVSVSPYNPAYQTVLTAKLVDIDNGAAVILAATSPPLTGTPQTLAFQAALADAYAFVPTRRLQVQYGMVTTSPTPVTVSMSYGGPTLPTWVQLPFSMTGGLSTVPAPNVTPGLLQLGLGILTTVAGLLTVPLDGYNVNLVTVDAGLILNGITTLSPGTMLFLTFANACRLKTGATGLASGFSPLMLGTVGTTPEDINWNGATPKINGSITLTMLPLGPSGALVWKQQAEVSI